MNYEYYSVHALVILVITLLVKQKADINKLAVVVSKLKSEVDKFLQPRIAIFIGNELIRRLQMKDTEKVTLSLAEVDAKNQPIANPQPFDAPPSWAIDKGDVASLVPSADGSTCDVVAGLPGAANISVSASIGGKAFSGTYVAQVDPGDVASISIQASAPVAQ